MKRTLLLVLACCSLSAKGQDNPCDQTVLLKTSKDFHSLYDRDIRNFLETFNSTCSSESFSDWRNELLFDILQKYPSHVVRVLQGGYRSLPINTILNELRLPVSEDVDLEGIIKGIEDVQADKPVKEKVLMSLRAAKVSSNP